MSMAATSAHAAEADDVAGTIPEIVVTAEKRETRLQSTPLAITAVSAEDLKAKNVDSLLDIGALAPNVMAGSQSTGGTQSGGFFIRGIGQDRSGITFDQGVGVYVDDVFVSRSDSSFLALLDVDRIEVLRGPQGTLFGKNTIGGAIRYISKQPTSELGGFIDVTGGSFNRLDVKGSVNIPLSDRLFLKVTAGALNRDGHVHHIVDDKRDGNEDVRMGRLQLRALLTDRITVDLTADRLVSENNGRAYTVFFIDANSSYPRNYLLKTGQPFDNRYLSTSPYNRYGGDDQHYRFAGYSFSGIVNFELSDQIALKSITAYSAAHVVNVSSWDGATPKLFDTGIDRNIDQFSQELQLTGNLWDGRLNFATGVYYLKETPADSAFNFAANDVQYPAPRLTSQAQTVNSYAAFGQVTFKATDALSITAGLRYSRDDKSAESARTDAGANPVTGYHGSGKGSWDDFSPRFAIDYQWTPTIMTYASVTKGFRSGGINILTSPISRANPGLVLRCPDAFDYSCQAYEPETVWNYEAGLRADLFDRHVRFNLTGFYMKYSNQQLTARDDIINLVYIQNVGKAHRTGVEIETLVKPVDGLTLSGNLGYLEAEYDDVGSATGVSTRSRVLRSPKWNYNLGATYETPVGEGTVAANLSYSWRSSQGTTSTDTNSLTVPSYGLLNARLQYNAPDKKWSIAVFATNLTDKLYYIGGVDFGIKEHVIGVSQWDVGRPREFGANVRFNF
jgi:iron complex outermembrane receptor protein